MNRFEELEAKYQHIFSDFANYQNKLRTFCGLGYFYLKRMDELDNLIDKPKDFNTQKAILIKDFIEASKKSFKHLSLLDEEIEEFLELYFSKGVKSEPITFTEEKSNEGTLSEAKFNIYQFGNHSASAPSDEDWNVDTGANISDDNPWD